ncbi:growth-arrest specific micro-tubule binding domain-containing protein [Purpureocillium lilacinum]|nr:growth-arrest specific micro-tubule binding domain-containing protein [Purpureocillium lilacinum]OAQ79941.1 growth-arrest specific micro-tubule binding domain-containing protein [Purpureocillium lilacinum]OAQ88655.1 growth-arrest specific micro-tubule binding domain-containing protein [Purpureocillium lilacinum]
MSRPTKEYAEALMEDLKNANTDLNKANSERDRYKYLYEQATLKLSQSHAAQNDLKAQAHSLKDDFSVLRARVQQLEDDNAQLLYENDLWDKHYTGLEKSYGELTVQYNSLLASMPSSSSSYRISTNLPERPKRASHHKKKPSSSSTRREHKESSPASRKSNTSNSDKEQKDRLSKRFEEKRPSSSGGRGSRRHSFIEGWGPASGSSASAAPPTTGATGRAFAGVATAGLGQPPAVSQSHNKVSFSSVPRTTANPLSPGLYSNTAAYDDEYYEDGNYHPYPVAR